MTIVLFSKSKALINEVKKSKFLDNLFFIQNIDKLFDIIEKNDDAFILLQHLNDTQNHLQDYDVVAENFINYKLIALRNSPENIEGASLMKKGYRGYMHAFSNVNIIEDAIETVQKGNSWVYPELMEFFIASIPLKESATNKILDTITPKELEVLELVAQGKTNSDIAKILHIAEVTVKKHISSMFKKLSVKDRLSLALYFKDFK